MKKTTTIGCLLILVCAFIIAILTRLSYEDDLNQEQYFNDPSVKVCEDFDINEIYLDSYIKCCDDLFENSDVIVLVNKESDSIFNSGSTISKVKVKNVYKGEIGEDYIYIIEPIYYFKDGNYILSVNNYQNMKNNNEYVIFLKKYESCNICDSKYIYTFTTSVTSKYNIESAVDLNKTHREYMQYEKFREYILEQLLVL